MFTSAYLIDRLQAVGSESNALQAPVASVPVMILVTVSPQMTLPPAMGEPSQICMFTAVRVEPPPAAPVWYA